MAKQEQNNPGTVVDAPRGSDYQLGAKSVTTEASKDQATREPESYFLVDVTPASDHTLAEYELWPRVFATTDRADAMDAFRKFYSIVSTVHTISAVRATREQWNIQQEIDKTPVRVRRSEIAARFAKAAAA